MSKGLITPITTIVTKEAFQESISQWEPSSKEDSIRMLHFISAITKYSKHLKTSCYNFLQANSSSTQNAVDPKSGLEVTFVTPKIKVYKSSPKTVALLKKIEDLTEKLEDLKSQLKVEYEVNGIDYELDGEPYYKTK